MKKTITGYKAISGWDYIRIDELKEEIRRLEIDGMSHISVGINDCWGEPVVSITASRERLETDEECELRLDKLHKESTLTERRERAVFEELKKKFEDEYGIEDAAEQIDDAEIENMCDYIDIQYSNGSSDVVRISEDSIDLLS